MPRLLPPSPALSASLVRTPVRHAAQVSVQHALDLGLDLERIEAPPSRTGDLGVSTEQRQPIAPPAAGNTEAPDGAHRHDEPPRLDDLHAALWRASELGSHVHRTVSTGWAALDRELPGGGWPMQSVTEILSPQPSVLEWRLLSTALRSLGDGQIIMIGPPKQRHLPGLLQCGLDQRKLVWIQAEGPAERLWVTEQVIRAKAAGAVLAWLPQARQDQLRRLQVSAQTCDCPVFLMRPQAARHEASPAPLRVHAAFAVDWALQVQVYKRRGPTHDAPLLLPSVPAGVERLLTPRLLRPSQLISAAGPAAPDVQRIHDEATPDVVGGPSPLPSARQRQRAAPATH